MLDSIALSIRMPKPSPLLDKNRAPIGPEILSNAGTGVWRKAPRHFQTPILYWMHFGLQELQNLVVVSILEDCTGMIRDAVGYSPIVN